MKDKLCTLGTSEEIKNYLFGKKYRGAREVETEGEMTVYALRNPSLVIISRPDGRFRLFGELEDITSFEKKL